MNSVLMNRISVGRLAGIINKRLVVTRSVSTSSKKHDTAVVTDVCEKQQSVVQEQSKVNKNWISYGFHTKDKTEDRFWTHITFFTTITLCMTMGFLFFAYMPDHTFREWAQREAFLEIARREKNGLPLLDPNLIDLSKVQLPSDEELGDTEIII
ncbi:hypothetical protein WA026_008558 [Henosepilachna vigintioctopunctata]|uniref:NADH dehydrogenase [ubiquinone] 1 beta subcomplex subunit 11, mitochondrial n=1 Tax=Henosepilachna vigintioctopunctata TaxID=420089 RepID=A0AAW1U8H3_9CUCU